MVESVTARPEVVSHPKDEPSTPPLALTEVASPFDVAALAIGAEITVGARVLERDGSALLLTDARRRITVHAATDGTVAEGDFVLCRLLKQSHDEYVCLSLHRLSSPPRSSFSGDFQRLGQSGRAHGLVARSAAKRRVMALFEERAFVEVETPSLVTCPGLDAHVHSLGGVTTKSGTSYLITSPEFHMKRLLSCGMPRIYQFARCFRAEEQGPLHEPQFTMLEWYRSFSTWDETMRDTEDILRVMADEIASPAIRELLDEPFERLRVSDAFSEFCGIENVLELSSADEDRYFQLFVDQVEPGLAKRRRPVFLTHYPENQASLAQRCSEVPGTAERYELYFRGIELCNGFSELTSESEQRSRFEREQQRRQSAGEPVYPIDEKFLSALAEGIPPCSGNALGFDRAVAALLEQDSLSSVMPFTAAEA